MYVYVFVFVFVFYVWKEALLMLVSWHEVLYG